MHPFFEDLMRSKGWGNITEMARATGISEHTLRDYAYYGRIPKQWAIAKQISKATNISADKLLDALVI